MNQRTNKRKRYLEQFIDEEQESNFSRSKPIPNNMELKVNSDFLNDAVFEEFPEETPEHIKTTLETMRNNLLEKSKRPMMKIEKEKTNKELKQEFGVANLEKIIAGDENLYNYLHGLNSYGDMLIRHNMKQAAKLVLEHAVKDINSDITKSHELLKSIQS